MQIIGEKVQHTVFGIGEITAKQNATMTVSFPSGDKMFLYPDAFTNFLVLVDQDKQKEILDAIEVRDEKEHQKEMIAQEKWRKEVNLRNMRISVKSQAVFDVKLQDIPELFESWSVSTGVYASGYSKGEPRIPDRMKPNSACLITVRPQGGAEADREILGIFMAEDTFEGKDCDDGLIHAHPEYRLQLKEPVKFWPYVTDQENKKKWGNTTLKYMANTIVEKILSDVRKALRPTEQRELAEEFYQYYCRLNRLQATKI